jgi:hypothetical protein
LWIRQEGDTRKKTTTSVLGRLEVHFLEGINIDAPTMRISLGQALDSIYGAIYHASQLASIFAGPSLSQSKSRFLSPKPGWISVELLWSSQPHHLAKVSVNGDLTSLRRATLAQNISSKRSSFNTTMDSSFFERLQGSGLRAGQASYHPAFGKCPLSLARFDQQKLNFESAYPIANRRHLLTLARRPKNLGQGKNRIQTLAHQLQLGDTHKVRLHEVNASA